MESNWEFGYTFDELLYQDSKELVLKHNDSSKQLNKDHELVYTTLKQIYINQKCPGKYDVSVSLDTIQCALNIPSKEVKSVLEHV